MKFIKLVKASEDWEVLRRHHDTEDGEEYYYIKGPDGIYQDEDGNTYKFDTKEDALEELDYLKAEHKFDKKDVKASHNEGRNYVGFDNICGGFTFDIMPSGNAKVTIQTYGSSHFKDGQYHSNIQLPNEEDYNALQAKINEGLLKIADEVDSKILQLMQDLGFNKGE